MQCPLSSNTLSFIQPAHMAYNRKVSLTIGPEGRNVCDCRMFLQSPACTLDTCMCVRVRVSVRVCLCVCGHAFGIKTFQS